MVPDPEVLPGEVRNALGGPEIRRVPGGQRPLHQELDQRLLLRPGQLRGSPRDASGPKTLEALLPVGLVPPKNGTHRRPKPPSDSRQILARFEQLDGVSAALLQSLWGSMRSHAP